MPERISAFDWSTTPLGPIESWTPSLRQAVEMALGAASPMLLACGPELVQIYNDAYISILGRKHPEALGCAVRESWAEIWDVLEPLMTSVLRTGQPVWREDQLLTVNRKGYVEEAYFTFSYSAIRDRSGRVVAILSNAFETTGKIIGERRLRTLRDLAAEVTVAGGVAEAFGLAANVLRRNASDVPFALVYTVPPEGRSAHLAEAIGLEPGCPESPVEVSLESPAARWPIAEVVRTGRGATVDPPGPEFRTGPWREPVRTVLVLPVVPPGQERPAAVLVTAASPRRELDAEYRGFFDVIAGQLATLLAGARADEEIRGAMRAREQLLAVVSHDLRNPLQAMTVVLDLLRDPNLSDERRREQLASLHRQIRRMNALVHDLRDVAMIESGGLAIEPTSEIVGSLVAEAIAAFRGLAEEKLLQLRSEIETGLPAVRADRRRLAQVFANLLANAIRLTPPAGDVIIRAVRAGDHVRVEVEDTGPGIVPEDRKTILDPLRRGRNGSGSRSGLGLAIARGLVEAHDGRLWLESDPGIGCRFCFTLPIAREAAPLPVDVAGRCS